MTRSLLTTFLTLVSLATACDSGSQQNRVVGELVSDRVELSAEVSEPITDILVSEGTIVAAGQVLVVQDSTRASARYAEAEAARAQAQARLDELLRGPRGEQIKAARANVEGAEHELDYRSSDLERTRRVHEKNLASAELLDRATAAFDAAGANLELRRAQLEELLAGTTVEELAQAEQALLQSEARRDAAQVDLDRHTLHAPIAGVTDSRLYEIGERPAINQPVMVLLSGEQPHARVYVPENLRAHVHAGTSARISVDGLDTAIGGRVRWVSSEAAFTPYFALTERDRGRLSFVAKVDITDDINRLPDGVPVEVEFDVVEP
jgi:HlyD family secretion protein